MGKIKKVKLNEFFYLDNVEPILKDCIQIRKICLLWRKAKSLLRFSQLAYVIDLTNITNIKKYISELDKNTFLLCTRSFNNQILYVSLIEKNKDYNRTAEIDVISNSKKRFRTFLKESQIYLLWDHYIQCFDAISKTNKYDFMIFYMNPKNKFMMSAIEKGLINFVNDNYPIVSEKKKGKYYEYKFKLR